MVRSNKQVTKQTQSVPETVLMSTEQRIEFLANLIVDRIMEDQVNGRCLLNGITKDQPCQTP